MGFVDFACIQHRKVTTENNGLDSHTEKHQKMEKRCKMRTSISATSASASSTAFTCVIQMNKRKEG
jgi:hypothetical protein